MSANAPTSNTSPARLKSRSHEHEFKQTHKIVEPKSLSNPINETPHIEVTKMRFTPLMRLLLLVVLASLAVTFFMAYNVKGNINYVLNRRAMILITMVIVAFCAGVSTVLFQTLTNNRILSPAIMGFENLFILIQTMMLFIWGEQSIGLLSPTSKFMFEAAVMIIFSLGLYLWIFKMRNNNLFLVLLIGIVCGSFFSSLATLMQRMLNPNEFSVLQSRMFATFNSVPNINLLIISGSICIIIAIAIWRLRHSIDVLTLGRENAITLGLNYNRLISFVLILTAILVAISTALVGPMTFYGFLVASLTYQYMHTYLHRYLLPASLLIGVIALVGGQFVLQHLLNMTTTLSVVINFIGGVLFLIVLLRRASL